MPSGFVWCAVVGFILLLLLSPFRAEILRSSGEVEQAVKEEVGRGASSWLDEVYDAEALKWVSEQNARTRELALADPRFFRYRQAYLGLDRTNASGVPMASILAHDGWLYLVRKDTLHPRGVWERIREVDYLAGRVSWETVLDIGELGRREGRPWIFHNQPAFFNRRALVMLSPGGGGAFSWREFDLEAKKFVDGGFVLPQEFGLWALWKDEHTLLVSDATRHRVLEWSRGTDYSSARTILNVDNATEIDLRRHAVGDGRADFIAFCETSNNDVIAFRLLETGAWARLTLPSSVNVIGRLSDQWILRVGRSGWRVSGQDWPEGALLSIRDAELVGSEAPRHIEVIHAEPSVPTRGTRLTSYGLLVITSDNVRDTLWNYTYTGSHWRRAQISVPNDGTLSLSVSNSGATAFAQYETFLEPPTLYHLDLERGASRAIQRAAHQFDASCCVIEQLHAVSKDGTSVPYFLVRRKGARGDGQAPTLVEGYGFAGSIRAPHYDGALGKLWLEQGGAYASANVRGGSEFGPSWRVRGVKRARTYEDMISVAEDLISRKITSPRRLGITGFSNGGLLAAVTLNTRPELFNAGVISHAVLDQFSKYMPRNHPEYGSKDVPEELAFIKRTSPYQNLTGQQNFPPVLILTATNDDDVAPTGARKYAAKLAMLNMTYMFDERPEGGHGYGVTVEQESDVYALIYSFLAARLM